MIFVILWLFLVFAVDSRIASTDELFVLSKKKDSLMATYETNLASEFHILSLLHRLGIDATLTLGNKKSVDIVVVRKAGDAVTIDVKGVTGKYDWPADNIATTVSNQHFIAFVSYEGAFRDPTVMPSVWIVPFEEVTQFMKQYTGRKNIARALLTKNGERFRNAWHLLDQITHT